MSGVLVGVLAGLFALSGFVPILARRLGPPTSIVIAGGFLAGAGLLASNAPAIVGGETITAHLPWIPSLDVHLSLALDGLSLLFVLLILGIGALVMAYSASYLSTARSVGRLLGLLTFFAASMLGLVLADDVFALFVFWELTSITSFFLIGGDGDGRAPAVRAFIVTGVGGLALLAGFVLLSIASGTTSLSAMDGSAVRAHAFAPAIIALVLVGAFTKSAQFPFHFWLPGAMVAPTPVSTYLHAATMVKAGLYLLARLSPLFAGVPGWRYTILITGLVTAVMGAALALKQFDLKRLLAYSTVSQLGFIAALIGVGTPAAIAAAAVHTIAHALYKATLFMVVGIVDREAGSRNIHRLSGLRRMMPITATVTALAAMSMAGLPPFLGFVSKEEAFAAFIAAPGAAWVGPAAGAAAVLASVLTFAYGARILDGAFGGPSRQELFEPARSFVAPAAIAAVGGLALAGALSAFDPLASRVVADLLGSAGDVHLALWHGFTPALGMSVAAIALGWALFVSRVRVDRTWGRVGGPVTGDGTYDAISDGLVRAGRTVGRPFLSMRPAAHVAWILAALAPAGVAAWLARGALPAGPAPSGGAEDWVVAGLLAVAIVGVVLAGAQLAAIALLGISGFLVAVLYVMFGAPDLAITQLLIETLTVLLVVLVFRRLPTRFRPVAVFRRAGAATAAGVVGVLAGLATAALAGRRGPSEAAAYFLEAGPGEAEGRNVVNTILVDFRALDTLGEVTVLAVAGIGVFTLVRAAAERRQPR